MFYKGVFLYFCSLEKSKIKRKMDVFLTLLVFLLLVFLASRQVFKNLYGLVAMENNERLAPAAVLATAVAVLSNLSGVVGLPERLIFCLSMTILSLFSLIFSILPSRWSRKITFTVIFLLFFYVLAVIAETCFMKFHASCIWDDRADVSRCFKYASSVVCCMTAVIYMAGVYERLSDIKYVMRASSVWASVCLYVDSVYNVLIVMLAFVIPVFNSYVAIFIMLLIISAMCQRIYKSSVFVVFSRHERRIVESMKVAHSETSSETPGADLLYTNIYERLLGYFEKHKPYLKSDLTINDIVDVVYTNKLYISKAISHCTKRNFCQFVNYHRITYAVELFRANPALKVVELAARSGFNSTTSFTAAFKLYMGDKPGDWCRMERARLVKK